VTETHTPRIGREAELLDAARRGDEGAYRQIVEPHRAELHAHCYRMLGSLHDAEDALQETFLRAWQGLPRFEGRSPLRSWLYRIATNVCLNQLGRRPKRVLPVDYGPAADPHNGPGTPLVESVWVEPFPDERVVVEDGYAAPEARYEQRESVELAFVAALQHLPATQRAVLILREVLGFSAREVAEQLETTVVAVNSALQRARAAVEDRLPDQSQQATVRALGDDGLREIVDGYVEAWERGDVEAVVSMLAEDATITMPPMPTWFRGREAISVFLSEFAFARHWSGSSFVAGERRVRLLPIRASGQVAFAAYHWQPDQGRHTPTALQVLTLDGSRIAEIAGFVTPAIFPRFGLPDALN
jgi:RNA polymerase sigma-70 factor, ECF subfamily